ncbi:MAG: MBL fold metallo-hydrolase [Muribaculaceae bacterium]|nr:MBL fold metallo-hydrolase [Muribaculaceae bacterium]
MALQLTYLFHDSFIVSSPDCNIIFDFWKRPAEFPAPANGFMDSSPFGEEELHKPLYVFVSHFHKDHYNPDIFEWQKVWKERGGKGNVKYIISADVCRHARHILHHDSIYKGYHPDIESVVVLRKGKKWNDELITVTAYGSTDIGNSYLVTVDGKNIFHAGDLNAWIWKDESTEEEVIHALNAYRSELRPIVSENPRLDIALFPVDSRIGTDYFTGASILLDKADVGYFIPMHFMLGENEEEQARLSNDALRFGAYAPNDGKTVFVGLTAPGDKLLIP